MIDRLLSIPQRFFSLLGVKRCLFCRLPIEKERELCKECETALAVERLWECGACGSVLSECECSSAYLAKNGVRRLIKLYRYRPDTKSRLNLLLYRLKRHRQEGVRAFLSRELLPSVRRVVDGSDGFVITYVPRTARARRRHGFDQSEDLSQALGERLSIPVKTLIRRTDTARKQKELHSLSERIRHAKSTFLPVEGISLKGKRLLLVDDTVTTGASLIACAYVLRKMGAREVIAVSPFVSFRHKGVRPTADKTLRPARLSKK